MAIGLAKGIPRMLGLYYKDGGNGSKQLVDLWSVFNLRDVRLALISVISKTDDF